MVIERGLQEVDLSLQQVALRLRHEEAGRQPHFVPSLLGLEALLRERRACVGGVFTLGGTAMAVASFIVLNTPEAMAQYLAEDEMKLYRLIWMRFVASQMTPAVFDQTTIDVETKGKDGATYIFRATGSVPKFDGFLRVYEEGKDAKDEDDEELKHKLPVVTQGEVLRFKSIEPEQHFTEPPPRFTEATLVKELEADGVGRPSTYASILSTIQEREYVRKEGG